MNLVKTTWRAAWCGILVVVAAAMADEGMWLYNAPPKQILMERHQFEPTAEWLEHLQMASVRFNSGGSASFVSEEGLILSNHHVGAGALYKLSDATNDYLREGFYARTRAEEKICPNLELNVLMSIEDVTARVNAAVKAGASAEEAFAARRAVMAQIEKASLEKTGLRSDVVTLYQGGLYHLYRFKRYTDVRLVFAPEQQIAFFGGDPDNFEYPRYDLDVCLFRAYEDGRPARVRHYLKFSPEGVRENDLVFVSGHPGRTSRQLTVAELEYLRDQDVPYTLHRLNRLEVLLQAFSARALENERRAKRSLFGVQNGRKAWEGRLAGLRDARLMTAKVAAERRLRDAVRQNPAFKEAAGAWDRIARAQGGIGRIDLEHKLLEGGHGFQSALFGIARTLWRAAAERTKPDGDRLREFRDSNRASLELNLFSNEPIYDDLEQLKLADSLGWLGEHLGWTNALVQRVMAGQSPRERSHALVTRTRLKDVAVRRKLYDSDAAGMAATGDPMIELARLVDSEARRLRQLVEVQEEIQRQAYAQIARVRFDLDKTSGYPDATFTLRLAFGPVAGYRENGASIPFQTTFAGLYERSAAHRNQPPFDLPARWVERKDRLDLTTPFNFVCTADIIGGNSGSPVVNRRGEFVGIIFDGNIQSLALDYAYTDRQARAVSVNSQAILEALRKVYDAAELADELTR